MTWSPTRDATLETAGVPVVVVDQRQLSLRAPFPRHHKALPYGARIDSWAPVLHQLLTEGPARNS